MTVSSERVSEVRLAETALVWHYNSPAFFAVAVLPDGQRIPVDSLREQSRVETAYKSALRSSVKTVRAHKHTCSNVQPGSTFADKCDCGALDTAGNAIEINRPSPAAPSEVAVPREFIEFVRNAPVSSGFCCCGDAMDKHGPFDGHAPTDQWEYSLHLWLEQIGYKP